MQKKAIIAIVVVVIVALIGIKLLAYWSRQAAERSEAQASLTDTTAIATPIEITAPQAPAIAEQTAAVTETAVSQPTTTFATDTAQPSATFDTGATSLLPHDVKEVQVALKNAGFDPGSVDGKLGRRTKAAIMDFQTANNLKPDGKVGPKTWSKLSRFLTQGTSVEQ